MLTWLKKYGMQFLRIVGVISGALPAATALWQTSVQQEGGASPGALKVVDTFTKIVNEIVTVEAAFTAAFGADAKTGAAKLQAVAPLVSQIIQASEVMVGKKIHNEALFIQAIKGITSNSADLLNSLDPKSIEGNVSESGVLAAQPVPTVVAPPTN